MSAMTDRERMQELHLALDGAVDQLGRAQRLAVGEHGKPAPESARIEAAYGMVTALRNELRDRLMTMMTTAAKPE